MSHRGSQLYAGASDQLSAAKTPVLQQARCAGCSGRLRRNGNGDGRRTVVRIQGMNRAAVEQHVDALNVARDNRHVERAVAALVAGRGQPLPRHTGQDSACMRDQVAVMIKQVVPRHMIGLVGRDAEIFQRLARVQTDTHAAPNGYPE